MAYLRFMNPKAFTNTANVNRTLESMVKYGLIVPTSDKSWKVTARGVRTMVSLASVDAPSAVLAREAAHV